ncbi:hypothetical protein G6F70_001655 [Rhizopus microsporus]|uniref:Calcineurin-like phosphoesterase domain-containing protein n=2 Tax=Rhizopus TaxID=4842 RepID=A0A367K1K6_RHIAZ|nr:hypothetical protein G6F71_000463 [Rhizopus microsporus]RCH96094.1 hypothetical protein CU097_014310 [Rhizopus azygosporus]KAG1203167.1 hypothetical protein G6F70_001655 [Rhizopus microsporus]KAG1215620.1 hypothetical protein G6F69_000884 [Rhizopus microsporus]KAG1238142.1 hypothetical protein G6F67_000698 [Rhizopus microsporus]
MVFFNNKSTESIEYIDAIPENYKTKKQKRLWKIIGASIAAVVIIIIVIVVAVVVTDNKKRQDAANTLGNDANNNSKYPISPYSHMTQIITNNDTSLQQKERIFVVGDIHGCIDEFNALISALNYTDRDQLILAGDLTSKGPDSIGVIRRAKELGALCVRGNHDDKLIRFKTFELVNGQGSMAPPKAVMPEGNVPDPLKFNNYHEPIALNMSKEDYDYLSSCPVILHLPFLNNTIVVHGGLDPSIPALKDQVPYLVMNMRDIDKNNIPTRDKVGTQWAVEWNSYQKSLTVNNTMIYYGHDAGRGLNLQQYTFGVDTGCVYGNQLTAINIRTHELTQVKCAMHYPNGGDEDD